MARKNSPSRTRAEISREQILIDIFFNLGLIRQWREVLDFEWSNNVSKYMIAAETLIELLEVHDCGSVGGFDKGQTHKDNQTLFHRWKWLVNRELLNEKLWNKLFTQLKMGSTEEMELYWTKKCDV